MSEQEKINVLVAALKQIAAHSAPLDEAPDEHPEDTAQDHEWRGKRLAWIEAGKIAREALAKAQPG